MQNALQSGNVYYLNPRRRAITVILAAFGFLVPFIPVALHFAVGMKISGSAISAVFFVALWYTLSGLLLYEAKQNRLVISAQGIECHDYERLFSGRTTWDNVDQIVLSESEQDCVIVLREPALPDNKPMAWLFAHLQLGRIMPLTHFMWHWQHGELGRDLKKFAPANLFQKSDQPS